MSDIKQKAEAYFKNNPEASEVYATTDNFLFVKNGDALSHAKTLNPDSPAVETIKNEAVGLQESDNDDTVKNLSPAEKKAIKEKATQEYTELYGVAPDSKLSGAKIQELNELKKTELANQNQQ